MTVSSLHTAETDECHALPISSDRQGRLSDCVEQFARGTTIHSAGGHARYALEILTGEVMLTIPTARGKRLIVSIAGPNGIIGLAVEGRYLCTAVALAPVTVRTIGFETKRYADGLAEQLKTCLRHQGVLSSPGARGRLASFLVGRAEVQRISSHAEGYSRVVMEFRLPISRGDLAGHLGMKAETLSRGLAELRNQNLIEMPGGALIRILDLNRLRGVCE